MKKTTLKKALEALGYEVVSYRNGYNFRSGFMKKENKLFYFNYEDLRWSPVLLVRTADASIKDKKGNYADYRGGINTYPEKKLFEMGIYIKENRKNWDFNRC